MASLTYPRPINARGFSAWVDGDVYNICDRLAREVSPEIFVMQNRVSGVYGIYFHSKVTGTSELIHEVERLTPDLITFLQEGDLRRPENSWRNYIKRREDAELRRQKALDDEIERRAEDVADRAAAAGLIHSPRVSMHVSRREKKEKAA